MSHLILLTLRLFPKVRLETSQFESALHRLTVGGLKHPGLPLNLPPFGVENKEYENKSQPIDRFSSYIAIYNWTYQVMDSPTLYNLDKTSPI